MITAEIKQGSVLGDRYRVIRRLGYGGSATVFLAEDDRLARQVAIKRLRTDAPEETLRRFKREARLGAALNHPNLVSIYDTLATEEGALIVMEYVPGRALDEVAGGHPMEPAEAVPILRSIADALDHVHSEGVVHRDVKPSNVMVRDDGMVKVADLGIAKATDATQITTEGSVVGTLPYMAPERLERAGAGVPESDVYALAAVAYELLSGRPPSHASSSEEAAAETAPNLRRDWPKAPPAVAAVIERGLSTDPDRRQSSAGDFVDELERALDAPEPAEATQPLPGREAPPRRDRLAPAAHRRDSRPGNRGAAIAAIAVLAVAGVAAAWIGLTGGGEDPVDDARNAAGGSAVSQEQPAEESQSQEEAAPQETQPASSGGGDGASLNDQGFALINQGRYEEAVPILEQAVASFPEGSTDITYAFALFNLGNALRLAGRPEEAIPILEQRLEIPNQRGTVARELELARREAGE